MNFNVDANYVVGVIKGAWERALPQLTDVILADISPFVKKDTGILDETPKMDTASLKQGKIVWDTPYAHRQWENYDAKTLTHHPLATKRWTEAAERQCKQDWDKQAQKLFARELGK